MTTKTCTKCGEMKPLDEYRKRKAKRDGRMSECKTCAAERNRRYREENREKLAEYHRQYREENREEIVEYLRRYYEQHPDTGREQSRRNHEEKRDLSKAMATVPPHTPWTSDEDALLMADNGMTIFQKAIELGRAYGAVKTRRDRLLAYLAAA